MRSLWYVGGLAEQIAKGIEWWNPEVERVEEEILEHYWITDDPLESKRLKELIVGVVFRTTGLHRYHFGMPVMF